ncbi:MAG: PH domain-containing protein [Mucinivorans sp.]
MKFNLRYDKLARYLTVIFIAIIVAIITFVFYTSGGSYFPAWLTTLTVSIALLSILSIPLSLVLSPYSIEIYCLLEVTRIAYHDIASIKELTGKQMRWCIPILGIFGIFGYYGYFIDLSRFRLIKIYTRRWSNFVMIETKNHRRIVVGLDDREEFLTQLKHMRKH